MLRIFLSILCLVTLAGCSNSDETNVSKGSRLQILHFGNGDEPQDIDPHIVTGVPEHHIISALLEGLVVKHPKDLTIEPAVAESWHISKDGRIYIFNLRKTARWSNGDPLTAADFVYSWKRALMPAIGNQYAYMLFYIKNAEAFYKGQINDFDEVGVKAINDHTLQVELKSPTPFFLQMLDHYSYFPVHRTTIEKHGAIDSRGTKWTRPGNYVGNGPFILKQWQLNRILIVEKNPAYWDKDKVILNQIYFYPIQNVTTEERMFRTGQLHITNSIPSEKILFYKNNHPQLIHISPYLGTYFYLLNTNNEPLNDVRVRRALAMSIDRRQIVEKITKGGQIPAYNLTPPDTNGYTANAKIPYDIDQARQLLAAAGYAEGKQFPTLNLVYNTSEGHRRIAIAIQQMWKTALNIDITLENQDWKVFLDNQRTMNYQIARASWIGDYLDPNSFLDMFVSDGGNNRTGWSNDHYDQLITQAGQTGEQNKRYAIFQAAEKILIAQVPIIPIYTYTRAALISKDVQGWEPNILDHHPYKYVSLKPAH